MVTFVSQSMRVFTLSTNLTRKLMNCQKTNHGMSSSYPGHRTSSTRMLRPGYAWPRKIEFILSVKREMNPAIYRRKLLQ